MLWLSCGIFAEWDWNLLLCVVSISRLYSFRKIIHFKQLNFVCLLCLLSAIMPVLCPVIVPVTVTVICIAPLLGDRGRITEPSVCFPVSVGRLEQKCVLLATKSSGRLQQWISVNICVILLLLHMFNGPFSGTTQVSRYQKGKTNLKQETVSGSGINLAICKSIPCCR